MIIIEVAAKQWYFPRDRLLNWLKPTIPFKRGPDVSAMAAGSQKEVISLRPQNQEKSGRASLRPKPGPQSGCAKHLLGVVGFVRHSVGSSRSAGLGSGKPAMSPPLLCLVYPLEKWGSLEFCEMAGMMQLCDPQSKGTEGVG